METNENVQLRKHRYELTMAQTFAVMKLLESEYTASKKNDVEFAKYATEQLGFNVAHHQLSKRRVEMKLPANKVVRKPVEKTRLIDRIVALEGAVMALTVRLQALENVRNGDALERGADLGKRADSAKYSRVG